MFKVIISVFVLFISISVFAEKTPGDWWAIKKAKKSAVKSMRKAGLRDTIIATSSANVFLYFPKVIDPKKPVILMIHGMGGNGSLQWSKQAKEFSKKYNVVIPDLVGYDKSTTSKMDFSPEFQANQLFEAMKAIGMEKKFYVSGFSYGGLVAAMFNKLYPESVEKIIIADSPVNFFSPRIADSITASRNLEHFEFLISPRTVEEVNEMFDACVTKPPRLTKGLKRKVSYHMLRVNSDTKRGQMNYLQQNHLKYMEMDYDLNHETTLFLWGTLDGAIPFIVGERLHNANPKANWIPIIGAHHDACSNFKKLYNREVLDFLGK